MNRYQDIPIININKKQVYKTVRYPEIPLDENDWYVISVQGDRFELLANDFYQDSSLYWIISIANPQLPQNSLLIPEGYQIRIPVNVSGIIKKYKEINS